MSLSHTKETPQKIPLWCLKSLVKPVSFTHDKNPCVHVSFTVNERLETPQSDVLWCLELLSSTPIPLIRCGVSSRSLPLQYHLYTCLFHIQRATWDTTEWFCVVSRVALFHFNTTYIHVSFTFNERLDTPQSGFVWCLKSLSSTSTPLIRCGVSALFHFNTTYPLWCLKSLSSTPIPLIYMSLSHLTSDLGHHRVMFCGVSSRSLNVKETYIKVVLEWKRATWNTTTDKWYWRGRERLIFCGVSSRTLPLQYHLYTCLFHIQRATWDTTEWFSVVSRVALFHSNTTYIHVSFTFNERPVSVLQYYLSVALFILVPQTYCPILSISLDIDLLSLFHSVESHVPLWGGHD